MSTIVLKLWVRSIGPLDGNKGGRVGALVLGIGTGESLFRTSPAFLDRLALFLCRAASCSRLARMTSRFGWLLPGGGLIINRRGLNWDPDSF